MRSEASYADLGPLPSRDPREAPSGPSRRIQRSGQMAMGFPEARDATRCPLQRATPTLGPRPSRDPREAPSGPCCGLQSSWWTATDSSSPRDAARCALEQATSGPRLGRDPMPNWRAQPFTATTKAPPADLLAPARSTAVARDLDIQRLSTNPPNRRPSRRRLRRSADLKASHGPKTRLRQSLVRQTPHAVDQPRPPPTPRCTPTALDRHSRLDSGGSRANGSTIGQFFSECVENVLNSYAVVGCGTPAALDR